MSGVYWSRIIGIAHTFPSTSMSKEKYSLSISAFASNILVFNCNMFIYSVYLTMKLPSLKNNMNHMTTFTFQCNCHDKIIRCNVSLINTCYEDTFAISSFGPSFSVQFPKHSSSSRANSSSSCIGAGFVKRMALKWENLRMAC